MSTKKAGRPTLKSEDVIDKFLEQIAQGESIRAICKGEGMPTFQTVCKWLQSDEKFCERYARAKSIAMDLMAEEILDISDDDTHDEKAFVGINHIQRDKLKVDSRKWLMSKLAPKKYGDKLQADITHKILPPPKWIDESL